MNGLREVKKLHKTKNETRWNSIYLMIKSFLKLTCGEVEGILLKGLTTRKEKNEALQRDLGEEEREKLVQLAAILKQLYTFNNIVQGNIPTYNYT